MGVMTPSGCACSRSAWREFCRKRVRRFRTLVRNGRKAFGKVSSGGAVLRNGQQMVPNEFLLMRSCQFNPAWDACTAPPLSAPQVPKPVRKGEK